MQHWQLSTGYASPVPIDRAGMRTRLDLLVAAAETKIASMLVEIADGRFLEDFLQYLEKLQVSSLRVL